MCRVKTAKEGCNNLLTTTLNTSWYVCSSIWFRKLLFSFIEYDDFFFNFQETIESSQSVSSTESEEIVALKQHATDLTQQYKQLSADYEQLR
jgi:hypothetical protein